VNHHCRCINGQPTAVGRHGQLLNGGAELAPPFNYYKTTYLHGLQKPAEPRVKSDFCQVCQNASPQAGEGATKLFELSGALRHSRSRAATGKVAAAADGRAEETYLNRFPLDAMPDDCRRLLYMALAVAAKGEAA
jgi:hypothetical protein